MCKYSMNWNDSITFETTLKLLLFLLIAFGITPTSASAADPDIYLNTTGWWRAGGAFNESATRIQAAIDNATDGEMIYVYNGTYTENVEVDKTVTLQGEGAGVVTVTADSTSDPVFEVTEDYVNISGFKVTGATGSLNAGFYLVSNVGHCNISDNNASNNNRGIMLESSGNNTLKNNTVSSNTNYGIFLSTSSNNTIYNNYFSNTNNSWDNGTNTWNTTKTTGTNIIGGPYLGGNYWSNYAGEDTDGDRLGDTLTPYNSSGNIANGGDYHPLMTVDTTAPSITIISPVNTTYSNASIVLNVTTNQTANVTYSLNGDTNLSLYNQTTSGSATITGLEGENNITVYANDPAGNLNYSTVNFTIDTIAPSLTIISPVNTTYSNASVFLNVTTNQTANVTYSLNGDANLSLYNLATSGNITITGLEGANNITVYTSDPVGNLNYSSINFNVDTTAPSLTIISPVNTTYSNASIALNVTTNQTANVTYSLNGDTNLSLYNLTTNGNTTITGLEGANNITVYANDSVGNLNSIIVYFIVDTTPPASITNLTVSAYAQTYINWTWTDPADLDFKNVSVYLNGIFQINVTNGTQYYYKPGLTASTAYTISTRTVDTYGNINTTWVNNTQTTSSSLPPGSVLTTITVSPSAATVAAGASEVFTAIARDQYGNTMDVIFAWSSSNTTVGAVGSTGVFNGQKVGTTTIKAASGSVSGSATATVVSGPLASIFISPDYVTIYINQTQQFNAAGTDSNGNAVSVNPVWNCSNISVGTINETTGVFTALTTGTASITATDGNISANATVTVMASTPPPLAGAPVITGFAPSSPVSDITGSSRTFGLTANQTVNVTWYINGTLKLRQTYVTTSSYTNTSAAQGIWNVTAFITNSNGVASHTWIWDVLAPANGTPAITGFSPPSPVSDIAGSSRTFGLTANQTANVTWYINGTLKLRQTDVTTSSYTNTSAAQGTWNVTAAIINSYGVASHTWIWNVLASANGGPAITGFSPPSPVSDIIGSSRTFGLTANQTVNVTWYINGSLVNTNTSVTEAKYTNTNATSGRWNVTAVANNANGTFSHEWIWIVGTVLTDVRPPIITISEPVNNSNISISDGIISGSITDDSDFTANMYVNLILNNTWTSNGSFSWQYNFIENDYNTIKISALDAYGNYNESVIRVFVLPATTAITTTSSSDDGESDGDDGVITAEPFKNILLFEMIQKDLVAGKFVTYTFSKNQDVYEVSVIGKEDEDEVAIRIEILKDISKQITEAAPGLVYRNVNILAGTEKISENVIKFKVKDSWLLENDLDSSDIRLMKWVDNKWITLETGILFNKDGYTHFTAKSMTFSIYAITGIKNEKITEPLAATEKITVTQKAMPLATEMQTLQTERKTLFWFWMILALLLVVALVYALKRR